MKSLVKQLLILALLSGAAAAQTPGAGAAKRYSQDGLSFDYPGGWALTDKSTPQAQHLVLARAGNSAVIMVIALRGVITSKEQLAAAREAVTKPYATTLAQQFGVKEVPANATQCQPLGKEGLATGFKLSGTYGGQPSTGEIYSLMLGRRFVSVLYVRADEDDAQAAPAWKAVLDSLSVETPAGAPPAPDDLKSVVSGGVLEGKLLKKGRPEYPGAAKAARAQGVVAVQVVVDEAGDVVSAKALGGHHMLREESERAAMKSKFTPTVLCGRPVKVTGVITYSFVLQ
ncbi:MAG TPA: TonB family protein [Pyrinomonadaceae bacterium]|nr:TonB family protein [Pyrinomonadaceae bacterium]